MVVHNSPVNRQLFQSHTGLNNLGNSTATTVTPIRENIDWARQRGPSAGIVDNGGISHNSTPGRLSTGMTDYQNLTSHHYSNSNLVNHQQNINKQTTTLLLHLLQLNQPLIQTYKQQISSQILIQ